uniref:Uncharacterized protein n=1 Tax=Fagus sylvatica TaxID=28930 RepID=A0A2N9H6B1_FAGSY
MDQWLELELRSPPLTTDGTHHRHRWWRFLVRPFASLSPFLFFFFPLFSLTLSLTASMASPPLSNSRLTLTLTL